MAGRNITLNLLPPATATITILIPARAHHSRAAAALTPVFSCLLLSSLLFVADHQRETSSRRWNEHVAHHGVSRSKAPTSLSSLHDVLSLILSLVCTLYLELYHRTEN
ncbi:hypothetical protein ALC62_07476 [Cyphomyrmex costatus]|uniref:Uncharacterized protein n=1 Tax=Cyphomyrmex costatus TaxID=456900 RepID=A0A195CM41_9HYME|nr:hypothetical protein ALC62_07476 [Cyphomyrmex costatus]